MRTVSLVNRISTVLKLALVMAMGLSEIVSANRLADTNKQIHCAPLPEELCAPSVQTWKDKGCITQGELEYALVKRPIPVPLCVELNGKAYFNSWCYCSCFARGTKIYVEDTIFGLDW